MAKRNIRDRLINTVIGAAAVLITYWALQNTVIGFWLENRHMPSNIYEAAMVGSVGRITHYLDSGVRVNDRDPDSGMTALHYAALKGKTRAVKFLIARGADVNVADPSGDTPLHLAAGGGHADVADILLSKGADINALGEHYRYTPLNTALRAMEMRHGRVNTRDVVRLLISRGADPNIRDVSKMTPLKIAERAGFKDIAADLRKHGAKP